MLHVSSIAALLITLLNIQCNSIKILKKDKCVSTCPDSAMNTEENNCPGETFNYKGCECCALKETNPSSSVIAINPVGASVAFSHHSEDDADDEQEPTSYGINAGTPPVDINPHNVGINHGDVGRDEPLHQSEDKDKNTFIVIVLEVNGGEYNKHLLKPHKQNVLKSAALPENDKAEINADEYL